MHEKVLKQKDTPHKQLTKKFKDVKDPTNLEKVARIVCCSRAAPVS
jgi:hypothetical protein